MMGVCAVDSGKRVISWSFFYLIGFRKGLCVPSGLNTVYLFI